MNNIYYFDNAATTLVKPRVVADAIYQTIVSNKYGNASRGAHQYSLNSARLLYQARKAVAKFFNIPNEENVAFTANVTMSLNLIINGIFSEGDHVIITSFEHNSVIRPLARLKEKHITYDELEYCKNQQQMQYSKLNKLIKPNTKAIICNHMSNVTGQTLDLKIISKFCRQHNLILIVDVAQSAGVYPIDMQALKIDILCFTGHKSLFASQGIGGICINGQLQLQNIFAGGSGIDSFNVNHPKAMPSLLEYGTVNIPAIAGLLAGIEYIQKQSLDYLRQHQFNLAKKFFTQISHNKQLMFYADYNNLNTSIIALNFIDRLSSDIANILDEEYNIAVRAGAHCAPLIHQALGTKQQGIVRFSFSSLNTEEEVGYLIESVNRLCRKGF